MSLRGRRPLGCRKPNFETLSAISRAARAGALDLPVAGEADAGQDHAECLQTRPEPASTRAMPLQRCFTRLLNASLEKLGKAEAL